jgi:hypothetical protein
MPSVDDKNVFGAMDTDHKLEGGVFNEHSHVLAFEVHFIFFLFKFNYFVMVVKDSMHKE